MLQLKSLNEIARAAAWWLRARHHFAVGPYGNEAHKPLGNLIVLNDDEIAPHAGFGLHPHANVEIVTYVQTESSPTAMIKEMSERSALATYK